jgi:hypothetical protein
MSLSEYGVLDARHIAELPQCPFNTYSSLMVALNRTDNDYPQIEPVFRQCGTRFYHEHDVIDWFDRVARWKGQSVERREAKEKAREAAYAMKRAQQEKEMRAFAEQQTLFREIEKSNQERFDAIARATGGKS